MSLRIFPSTSVRERYKKWLTTKNAYLRLKAFGINHIRATQFAYGKRRPSLMEAVMVDCASDGEVDVYAWADTERMEAIAQRNVAEQVDALWGPRVPWPQYRTTEYRKELRKKLTFHLSAPGANALAVVVKLGEHNITRERRQQRALLIGTMPVSIEDDDSEERLEKLQFRREWQQHRRRAFVRGRRATL